MSFSQILVNGKSFHVDRQIGKGGEGEVFVLKEKEDLALKVYNPQLRLSREQKISAMVSLDLADKYPLVSFPIAVAKSNTGAFIGFVMKLVPSHKPLHELYAPGPRKVHFPQADYRFLVRVACNVARAVASVHQAKCVIGDINHSGILISPKATVAIIDADSFQVTGSTNRYLCEVGVPEYTPPELQGQNFSRVIRTANHDAFGLAIVTFQLLFMGRHPFVGSVRSGEIPPLHENIKNFRYVYSDRRNVGMDQPPGTPSVEQFSARIADMFEKAFSSEGIQQRPTALEWVAATDELERLLVKCEENDLHYIPKDAIDCPWCEMEEVCSTVLFLPYVPGVSRISGIDPGAQSFNLESVWNKIDSIAIPSINVPTFNVPKPSASATATSSKPVTTSEHNSIGAAIIGGILFIAFPYFAIIWIPLIWWGLSKETKTTRVNADPFVSAYKNAEVRWIQELGNWKNRSGISELQKLKDELITAKEEYQQALRLENAQIQKYRETRRERQLHAFLDNFDISKAGIKGIGPAKLAALKSYGIDTAADIVLGKILTVPGFGPENSKGLVAWRLFMEKKFVYQAVENEIDRQEIARIRASTQAKLAKLRSTLNSGYANVANLATRVRHAVSIEDPVLKLAYRNLLQAKVDLEFLQISIPQAPANRTAQMSTNSTGAQRSSQVQSSSPKASVRCPRCGSSMVYRLARKGRNAGHYFWGCSRFPVCKGTRSS